MRDLIVPFSRGPAVEASYTHSVNSSRGYVGQFIGKISTRSGRRAADQRSVGPAYSPTHAHTHTHHTSVILCENYYSGSIDEATPA